MVPSSIGGAQRLTLKLATFDSSSYAALFFHAETSKQLTFRALSGGNPCVTASVRFVSWGFAARKIMPR